MIALFSGELLRNANSNLVRWLLWLERDPGWILGKYLKREYTLRRSFICILKMTGNKPLPMLSL